jgi:hypothetical protein
MNTSIDQFAGDTPGKRQSLSCCMKNQLQTVFYFIFCGWLYFVGTGTHFIPSTVLGQYFDAVRPILLIMSQWKFVFPVNDNLLYSVMLNNASLLVHVTTCRHKSTWF